MTRKNSIVKGVVERWDGNRVRPRVKTMRMGLLYRVLIDGQWYFFDTRGFRDAEVTRFFSSLESGMLITGESHRRRGHDCLSWVVGERANIAPPDVLRTGLLSAGGLILGLGSLELLSLIFRQQVPDHGFLAILLVFGELPIICILFVIAAIGAIFGVPGVIDAFTPRKLSAMRNYRREMAHRTSGVQS
ncbi:hypothetical protein [Paraburkholderia bannensis]|uniref:hypothetical protein n=1 Tax=Paraburkholderia bannensis TaxID=765414 RepID=UPI002AB72AE2|nr:hypothetical protein [Paraburkholderia bannensis]